MALIIFGSSMVLVFKAFLRFEILLSGLSSRISLISKTQEETFNDFSV